MLEERESLNFDEPNLMLTRLGPVASGGRMDACSASVQNRRVEVVSCHCDVHNWDELKLENATLKENLRQLELQEEELQPSKNDEIAQALVESNIKVVEDRYEIPVPLKQDVMETLPSNYDYALKRTKMLRTSGLKNPGLKDTLTNTFPKFLSRDVEDPSPVPSASAVRAISVPAQLKISKNNDGSIHNLIKSAPDLYTLLKKRFANLNAFKQFLIAKSKGIPFQRPELNTSYFIDAVKYVQFRSFGAAITLLKEGSPDNFDQMLKKLQSNVNSAEQMRKINELKTLRNLRPWVDAEFMLCVEGRLENAELPINARHPFWGTLRILQNGGCTVLVAFIAFTHRLGRVKKLCDGPQWQCWQITRGVKQERSNISSEMFLKLPRFNCLCLLFMKFIIGYSLCCSFASCCFM